jgi:phosphatidylethanolamine/phosphatidyl-N-methylethanolamine N-methyltransferase
MTMEIAAVTRSYARWAPVYDLTFGSATNRGRARAAAYVTRRGGAVLEVGVGTGLALPSYGPEVTVTGVDYSPDMLAKAEEKVRSQKLSHVAALRQMDARHLDFPDASFDTVAAMHVLSVVPEPERVMTEMSRVLRPGGEIVIVNHFARESGPLAVLERLTAPLENLLGWHSDFPMSRVLGVPGLVPVVQTAFPPFGMMTFLVLRKTG